MATVRLLVVKLQVLQALCEGQFLLNGHSQEGVQGLLFIFSGSQLPLHLIQLSYVLVTSGESGRENLKMTHEIDIKHQNMLYNSGSQSVGLRNDLMIEDKTSF